MRGQICSSNAIFIVNIHYKINTLDNAFNRHCWLLMNNSFLIFFFIGLIPFLFRFLEFLGLNYIINSSS